MLRGTDLYAVDLVIDGTPAAGSTSPTGMDSKSLDIPSFMTFMGHDPQAENTIIVATNLAATPEGKGSALVLAKAIIATLYDASSVPEGSPAGPPADET